MAVLNETQRFEVWRDWMADVSNMPIATRGTVSITKADLRAAVDALDDFLDANAATINAAIPQPARSGLSAAQKARLLAYVAIKRWGDT